MFVCYSTSSSFFIFYTVRQYKGMWYHLLFASSDDGSSLHKEEADETKIRTKEPFRVFKVRGFAFPLSSLVVSRVFRVGLKRKLNMKSYSRRKERNCTIRDSERVSMTANYFPCSSQCSMTCKWEKKKNRNAREWESLCNICSKKNCEWKGKERWSLGSLGVCMKCKAS